MRFRLMTTVVVLMSAPSLNAQATPARTLEQLKAAGRQYAEWVIGAQADSLSAHAVSPEMVPDIHKDAASMAVEIAARAGTEVALIEERMVKRNKADQYWRVAKYSLLGEPLVIRIVVSPDGKYAGIGVGPLSQVPPVDPPAP